MYASTLEDAVSHLSNGHTCYICISPAIHLKVSTGGSWANFDGRGGAPWYVVFEVPGAPQVAGLEMNAMVAAESPRQLEISCADSANGPWTLAANLTTDRPWGAGVGGTGEVKRWPVNGGRPARFWKVSIITTHNGDAPTIHYVQLFPKGGQAAAAAPVRKNHSMTTPHHTSPSIYNPIN